MNIFKRPKYIVEMNKDITPFKDMIREIIKNDFDIWISKGFLIISDGKKSVNLVLQDLKRKALYEFNEDKSMPVVICDDCFNNLGFEESLTLALVGEKPCYICGTIIGNKEDNYNWVWSEKIPLQKLDRSKR